MTAATGQYQDLILTEAAVEPFVDAAALALALDDPLVFKLRLILEELVVNALTHGGGAARARVQVQVTIRREADKLRIEVQDDGVAFDPTAAESPDVGLSAEDRDIGGLGIHFVRQLTQEFSYERVGEFNRLSMVKRL
jgi:serine/threonine-protein kinase RsbW